MRNKLAFSKLWFISLLTLTLLQNAFAQPGALDTSFVPFNDNSFGNGSGFSNSANSMAIQPDQKIIIGGSFLTYNNIPQNRISRLNPDGSLDYSFQASPNLTVYKVALQNDGKILLGGDFTEVNGVAFGKIARLMPDGSIDNDFSLNQGFNDRVNAIEIQNDGKIVVGGEFTTFNGLPANGIIRLNADGSRDISFNFGSGLGGISPFCYDIKVQSDGKIICAGLFTSYAGINRNNIVQINNDGSIDLGFNPGTGFNNHSRTITIQNDGKIIIGGNFTHYNGTAISRIARINLDGTLDGSFYPSLNLWSDVLSTKIDENDNIYCGSGTSNYELVKLNSSGAHLTSFALGLHISSSVLDFIILDDGKILAAGSFFSYLSPISVPGNTIVRTRIAKLNPDSTLDLDFSHGSGFNNNVSKVKQITDNKILVGGSFSSFDQYSKNRMARLNENGTVDQNFNPGLGAFVGVVNDFAVLPDQKIIVVGTITKWNDENVGKIVRLNPDGTMDYTFNTGTGFNNDIYAIDVQEDGAVFITGNFTSFNGIPIFRLAKLNSDGTLDNTFNSGSGLNNYGYDIVIQSDGKIIVGGVFTEFNGTPMNRIARINTDGTLDASFSIGSGFNSTVNSISLDASGGIYIGGSFSNFNGQGRSRIALLNSNGQLNNDFNVGSTLDGQVRAIKIQNNDQLIIAGDFTNFGFYKRLAFLNTDGTLNTNYNFNPPTAFNGFNNHVNSIEIQSDGKILLGGNYFIANGQYLTRLVRLNGENCVTSQGVDEISSCDPITWIDGNTYSSSNNTATHLLEGAAQNGCDSLVTLNFTLWPCTQLQSGDCNATNVNMDQNLRAVNVNAPNYRFKITGPNNGGVGWNGNTFILDRPNRALKFSLVPGSYWGSTYSVEVAVGDGNGNFGSYGNACTASLSNAIPTTQLQASDCGAMNVSPSFNLLAVSVSGATGYRYRVNGFGVAPNTTIEKTMGGGAMRKLKMNEVAGIGQGETYTIEVAIRDAAGNWGAYGFACEVTLMGAPDFVINNDIEMIQTRDLTSIEFGAMASQNPFTTSFSLQVLNANDSEIINVSIYDMSGKLIESNIVNPMDIESAKFGMNLASGMYMVEVRQGSNQAVVRQVKN